MNTVSTNVGKDSLQPGDSVICESKHVLLFAGWSDSSKTHYIAMDLASASGGSGKKIIPYPYYNGDSCFHPIRYHGVCWSNTNE